jgi:amidase
MPRTTKAKPKRPWQNVVQEAQNYRDASLARVQPSIPETPAQLPRNVMGIPRVALEPDEVRITELPIEVLLDLLASGKVTATTVTKAFLRRAGLAQKLVFMNLQILFLALSY